MLALLLHGAGFAQENHDQDDEKDKEKLSDYDEIIIKRKGDKDSKVTVEIKNGDVFINGKPLSEFDDDNVSVRRKKVPLWDGDSYTLAIPPSPPHSPFRGGAWNYSGDDPADSKRAFLGVAAEKSKDGGAEIREVTRGSAAEKLGLKKGDIITKIDDTKIDDPETLTETIRKHKPEDKVVVTYKRDGKEQKATAVLGKFKGAYINSYSFKMPRLNQDFNFDFNAPDIHFRPRIGIKAQDTEDGKGVKVLDVDEDSPAEKAGIEEGDIITQFDGKEVKSAGELADLARESQTKPSFKIKLEREGKSREVEVKIPKKLKTADL